MRMTGSDLAEQVLAAHRDKGREYSLLNEINNAARTLSNPGALKLADDAKRSLVGILADSAQERVGLDWPLNVAIAQALAAHNVLNPVDAQTLTQLIGLEFERRDELAKADFKRRAADALMPGIARNTPVSEKDEFAATIETLRRRDDRLPKDD